MNIIQQEIDLLYRHIALVTEKVRMLDEKLKQEQAVAPAPSIKIETVPEEEPARSPGASEIPVVILKSEEAPSPVTPTVPLKVNSSDSIKQLSLEGLGKPPCKVEGCDRPVWAKEFCTSHYQRNKRYNDPLGTPEKKNSTKSKSKKKTTKKKKLCTYGECRAPFHAKGLCSYHYRRMMDTGHPSGNPEEVLDPIERNIPETEEGYESYHIEAERIIRGIKEGYSPEGK